MYPILVLFSDEFIHQGGDWVDVPSQKTEVVSGVLCLAMFVFVLAENINCSIAILGPSTVREVVHPTTSREGNSVFHWV